MSGRTAILTEKETHLSFPKSVTASQDFLRCMPRVLERIPGHLIAHFEGLTEDQARASIASLNAVMTIDMIVLEEGLLLFQVTPGEEEALKQRVKELPCFTSCDHAFK